MRFTDVVFVLLNFVTIMDWCRFRSCQGFGISSGDLLGGGQPQPPDSNDKTGYEMSTVRNIGEGGKARNSNATGSGIDSITLISESENNDGVKIQNSSSGNTPVSLEETCNDCKVCGMECPNINGGIGNSTSSTNPVINGGILFDSPSKQGSDFLDKNASPELEGGVNSHSQHSPNLQTVVEEVNENTVQPVGSMVEVSNEDGVGVTDDIDDVAKFGGDSGCVEKKELERYGGKVDNLIIRENLTDISFIEGEVCCSAVDDKTLCYFDYCLEKPGLCDLYENCCSHFSRKESCDGKPIPRQPYTKVSAGGGIVCKSCGSEDCDCLMIRKCPLTFSNNEIRMLCEEDVPAMQTNFDIVTMVTDEVLGLTFFNKYCAKCNSVHETLPWSPRVVCDTYLYVLTAMDDTDLLRQSLRENSTCHVTQYPPTEATNVAYCNARFYRDTGDVISSCNVTGLEESYTPAIEPACLGGPVGLAHRVVSGAVTFKNAYCLLCNRKLERSHDMLAYHQSFKCPSAEMTGPRIPPPPFNFLFGSHGQGHIGGSTSDDVTTCSDGEWADPQGVCRKVLCAEGKILKDDSCVTAMDDIKGLPYRLRVWFLPVPIGQHGHTALHPQMDLAVQSAYLKNELLAMIDHLTKIVMETTVGIAIRPLPDDRHQHDPCRTAPGRPNASTPVAWMETYVEANKSMTRDAFETGLLDILNNETVTIERKDVNVSVSIKPLLMHDDGSVPAKDLIEECKNTSETSLCAVKKSALPRYSRTFPKSDYIRWSPILSCPHVNIPRDQITVTTANDSLSRSFLLSVKIEFGDDVTIELVESTELNQISERVDQNGSFSICRDLLVSKIGTRTEVYGAYWTIMYVLNATGITASALCLLATLSTYILFPVLRCLAGCNTMGLSFSLFVVQAMILLASSIHEHFLPTVPCMILGITLHHTWLSYLTWSFLCCLHMMIVFTSNRPHTHATKRSTRRVVVRNVILSFMLPNCVIACVMVTSYAMDKGIGYSFDPSIGCLNPLTVYIPLILVLLINLVFFVVVICKIRAVRRLQSSANFRSEDRRDFFVYIKLSTFTGVFWFLTVLSEYFNNNIFRYTATFINSSQGVYIFFSFVVNRRVMNLYAQRFKCLAWLARDKPGNTTTNGTTTTKPTKYLAPNTSATCQQSPQRSETATVEQ